MGVDSVWEQRKFEARKMPEKRTRCPYGQQSQHYSPGALPGVECILIPVLFRDAVLGGFLLCEAHYTNKALLPSRQNSYTQLNLSFHADSASHLNLLLCRLSNQLYHLHDGCDRSLGLFNHDAVTALFGKELLAVRR